MNNIIFPSIEATFTGLSAAFAIVALVIATIFVFFRSTITTSVKLLGSIMVLALAFAAHNAAVYALGIFIIATLVTDLDFLEKLAAIFWNRDKYWEYRLGTASPAQVAAKVATEAQQEIVEEVDNNGDLKSEPETVIVEESAKKEVNVKSSVSDQNTAIAERTDQPLSFSTQEQTASAATQSYRTKINETIVKAFAFEQSAQQALRLISHELEIKSLHPNAVISTPDGPVEIDAIIETLNGDLVVEIKHSKRPHILLNVVSALRRATQAYDAYGKQRGVTRKIIPVAILPTLGIQGECKRDQILILRLDPETKRFTNLEEFKLALHNYH
ncbi:hypothetical protein AB4Z32_04565 [Massilia sp. 2TAF26]|uniref:hypothetical protein n=1 Tax=Massilia sp. 2TAF26 TaxID=3233012 RepID=UPI003F95792B